jgi:hypothetical protein
MDLTVVEEDAAHRPKRLLVGIRTWLLRADAERARLTIYANRNVMGSALCFGVICMSTWRFDGSGD